MKRKMTTRVGASLGAVALSVLLAGLAVAQGGSDAATQEQAAIDRFCADQHPCVIVNGEASPEAQDSEARLVSAGEALAESGKPASACPEARTAYAETGIEVDAFVGPCPKGPPAGEGRAETAEALRANTEIALAAQADSR